MVVSICVNAMRSAWCASEGGLLHRWTLDLAEKKHVPHSKFKVSALTLSLLQSVQPLMQSSSLSASIKHCVMQWFFAIHVRQTWPTNLIILAISNMITTKPQAYMVVFRLSWILPKIWKRPGNLTPEGLSSCGLRKARISRILLIEVDYQG